ncbi:hypothetical protein HELRODRAFT_182824 [Helobdella robusta]|uniref:RNase H type-1 domain-containing protein n=1 Tax=Helobdella robusta TaxID=6412 RepID=T1FIT3_HELRO|nr:hypothetical protein HELRODRAFT_182824 [Helobdella robusta]ESN90127.1 hypothetical protein HELRODRAFT_182824 [Helobdella robusta]
MLLPLKGPIHDPTCVQDCLRGGDKNYEVLTDSMSTLLPLKQYHPRQLLTVQMQNKIHDILSNKNNLTLIWIPSHIGNEGNERIDKLASQVHLDRPPIIPKPHHDIKSEDKRPHT